MGFGLPSSLAPPSEVSDPSDESAPSEEVDELEKPSSPVVLLVVLTPNDS